MQGGRINTKKTPKINAKINANRTQNKHKKIHKTGDSKIGQNRAKWCRTEFSTFLHPKWPKMT